MTLRVTASTCTFAASQTDATVVSTIQNLTNFVSSNVNLRPKSLTLVETPPTDLLISEMVVRSEKNPSEGAHRVYKGPKVPLSDLMGAFARDALKIGAMTPQEFVADHGLEILWTYDNGTTVLNATFLWDIENQLPFGIAKQISLDDPLGPLNTAFNVIGGQGVGVGSDNAFQQSRVFSNLRDRNGR